ncbi:DUF3368 domain-containing protein [Coleofasciculus sp.]|uniref:DUF3368 domain-containing protein n=1 Tax=Coleofasciculus sp. TaxID=3100458 RepID=UPI003A392EB7
MSALASPITNLAAIAQLDLLYQLYGTILIPQAVYKELTRFNVPGAAEVQTLSWIETVTVMNREFVIQLESELDSGEAEAIALAVERQATLLMLDERRGVQVATRYGLRVQGVLGVLLRAKAQGSIPAVRPLLDALVNEAGFWITDNLYQRILQIAQEMETLPDDDEQE